MFADIPPTLWESLDLHWLNLIPTYVLLYQVSFSILGIGVVLSFTLDNPAPKLATM